MRSCMTAPGRGFRVIIPASRTRRRGLMAGKPLATASFLGTYAAGGTGGSTHPPRVGKGESAGPPPPPKNAGDQLKREHSAAQQANLPLTYEVNVLLADPGNGARRDQGPPNFGPVRVRNADDGHGSIYGMISPGRRSASWRAS